MLTGLMVVCPRVMEELHLQENHFLTYMNLSFGSKTQENPIRHVAHAPINLKDK